MISIWVGRFNLPQIFEMIPEKSKERFFYLFHRLDSILLAESKSDHWDMISLSLPSKTYQNSKTLFILLKRLSF